jgi:hypothetical protein
VEENNRNLKITRNGQTLVLHPSPDKNITEMDVLMEIRHFLDRSGAALPEVAAAGINLLVVIDHRHANIYKTEWHGSLPKQITPYDPEGFGRQLHFVQNDSAGQRKPERKSFYETVAQVLRGAEKILIFGSGTGTSSAMDHLIAELKRHHADVAKHVVGSIVLNETHLTEDQLLAKARDFYTKLAS